MAAVLADSAMKVACCASRVEVMATERESACIEGMSGEELTMRCVRRLRCRRGKLTLNLLAHLSESSRVAKGGKGVPRQWSCTISAVPSSPLLLFGRI